MKQRLLQKTLLLLFALIAGSTSVWADNYTYDFSTGGTHNSSDDPVTNTWVTSYFTILQEKNTSSSDVANYLTAPRWYKSHKITITPAAGVTITQITINCGASYNGQDITASTGSVSKSGSNSTWTGSITSTSPLVLTMGSQCRPSSLGITYTSAVAVLAPTFSPNGGEVEKGTSVVISTTTDGASIYYTTNGDAPTSSSTLYEGPLTINSAQTIKAIAIKGGDASSVTTATYTIKKVVAPTFSVAEGVVLEGTLVELSTTTDGASIYYTTNGAEPTSSSTLYDAPIEIDENMTIKAIAVKTNWDDSDVASATYTVLTPINGLSVDFEANDVSRYVDWEFTNIGTHTTTISAHGGFYYGSNVNSSDNGVTTASIKTKNKIEHPGSITFYISKESKNSTESSWYVEVSENGSTWTQVGDTQDATSMNKGSWIEVSRNLSSYANVYVRIRYNGSNAIRAIDDITLIEAVPMTITTATWASFSSASEVAIPTGVTAYYAIANTESSVTLKEITDIIPANEGVVINGTEGTYYAALSSTSAANISGNLLKPWLTAGTPGDETYYTLAVSGTDPIFKKSSGGTLAAGKSYLVLPGSGARELGVDFGNETAINALENSNKVNDGAIYDLSGRRVENPTKGIYIMNGKKFVVK